MSPVERKGNIEIDYNIREETLSISHLYVKQNERRQGLASEKLEEIIEEHQDEISFIRISISSNEASRKFLEERGYTIEYDNPGGLIEAIKRV